MRVIEAAGITGAVKRLFIEANRNLPPDVQGCLRKAAAEEPWEPARDVLEKIEANFVYATEKKVPICQDTGMACVFIEIGRDLRIEGDIYAAVDEG
ncbi:MAG: fumarate hydratase, partial [Spirochaetaceae bacterium]|nr:fumarate hydratase [Spirochaetaceae bacterium]